MEVEGDQVGGGWVGGGGEGVGRADRRDELRGRDRPGLLDGVLLQIEPGVARRQGRSRDDGDLQPALDLVASIRVGREQQIGGNVLNLGVVVGGAEVDGADAVGVFGLGAARRRQLVNVAVTLWSAYSSSVQAVAAPEQSPLQPANVWVASFQLAVSVTSAASSWVVAPAGSTLPPAPAVTVRV